VSQIKGKSRVTRRREGCGRGSSAAGLCVRACVRGGPIGLFWVFENTWGQYFDLGKREYQEGGDNYVVRTSSFEFLAYYQRSRPGCVIDHVKCCSTRQGLGQRPVPRLNGLVPPSLPWASKVSFLARCIKYISKLISKRRDPDHMVFFFLSCLLYRLSS
jgi:hypothetical protein